MLALGTQARRSAPGGPNYSVPRVYAEPCRGNILCRRTMDVVSVRTCLIFTVYINAAAQHQGHLHHHSRFLRRTLFMPPVSCRYRRGTIGRDEFIRQPSASTVIYQSIYPGDKPLSFSFLLFLCLLPPLPHPSLPLYLYIEATCMFGL